MRGFTRSGSASRATVSLNLARHMKISWNRTMASGSRVKARDVISDHVKSVVQWPLEIDLTRSAD